MGTAFAPTSAADIVWNQPPAPRSMATDAVAQDSFRQQLDRATADQQLAARSPTTPAPPSPAATPTLVPHPFYEGEFIDAQTGRIALPEPPPPATDDPTEGGKLVPHPFYEGEYYDPEAAATALFGEDGITVADVIDLINPLQHIPILSSIYRDLTGDTIDPGVRMVAGAALGGPIGFAVALVNAVVEDSSGTDVGGHMIAMVTGGSEEAATEMAALTPASGPAQTAAIAGPALAEAQPLPQTVQPARAPMMRDRTSSAASAIPVGGPMLAAGPSPAGGAGENPGPVEALLQARAAVPSAGPVAALGSNRPTRFEPPAPTPEQASQQAISAKLDAHLSRLAAMSGARPETAAVPPRPLDRPAAAAPVRAAPARVTAPPPPASTPPAAQTAPAGPTPVPTPLVPQAMSEALDKYRALMRPAPARATVRDHST